MNVGIIGMGKAVPEKILTNFDLEKIVETNDEWITTRTGIRERRIVDDKTATSDLASKAAENAISDAGISAEDIDLIIVATITPDYKLPSVASMVQSNIGAKNAATFDLNAGCSGWVYSIATANAFIQSGVYEKVLVIGAETLSTITNWKDRGTCILFGDGAGASVVAKTDEAGFYAFDLGTDGQVEPLYAPGSGSKKLTAEPLPGCNNKIFMVGKDVFKFAVKVQSKSILKLLDKVQMNIEDIDLFVPHQANYRIIESACERLNISQSKFMINLDKYGNTSAASIPLALCEAKEQNRIKKGDVVCVCGFGAGLTWASGLMKWVY
ncbi:MAG: ketoacyl-ACP synthase III [Armatimonadetes bacterium]|nr:ketoacyl-ACP synthase III [Candidatus Hippobium faecium]